MNREDLIAGINAAGRKMSTSTILLHQAIAEKAGMSGADHKYLDTLFQEGSMTAGKLAELTGLTTGAVTGIIDRLEKAGFVERERDVTDRRKVLVVPQFKKAEKKLGPVFEPLQSELIKSFEKYSDAELKIIKQYLLDTIELLDRLANKLKSSNNNR